MTESTNYCRLLFVVLFLLDVCLFVLLLESIDCEQGSMNTSMGEMLGTSSETTTSPSSSVQEDNAPNAHQQQHRDSALLPVHRRPHPLDSQKKEVDPRPFHLQRRTFSGASFRLMGGDHKDTDELKELPPEERVDAQLVRCFEKSLVRRVR